MRIVALEIRWKLHENFPIQIIRRNFPRRRRVYSWSMVPTTLPPPTAAIRALAHSRCTQQYRPASALGSRSLDASFADVLAGSATIVVYVDARGRPVAAEIVRVSDETFKPAALEVLAGWHYRPAMCGRRPVGGLYTAIFNS